MRIATLFFGLFISVACISQPTAIEFDGVDDIVDIGNSVGNGVRTIEFWFKPAQNITPSSLSDFSIMISREVNATNNEEFHISFNPQSASDPGKLRFLYSTNNVNGKYDVVSNDDTWNAGQWYHVAGVIDQSQGMMLFVDGIKQADTESGYTSPTATVTSDVTAIGGYAKTFTTRNFEGRIDDVRLSATALYSSNFTPPCPNIEATANSAGVYNFNLGSGTTAIDSSGNNYDGVLQGGATWVIDTICDIGGTGLNEENGRNDNMVKVYPNPARDFICIESLDATQKIKAITITDLNGKIVLKENNILNQKLALQRLDAGLYFYNVLLVGDSSATNGKLVITDY